MRVRLVVLSFASFGCSGSTSPVDAAPMETSTGSGSGTDEGSPDETSTGSTWTSTSTSTSASATDFEVGESSSGSTGDPMPPPRLCIVPIGDSITQADAQHVSYRYWLWERLRLDGFEVDMMGSQHEHQGGVASYPDAGFDVEHEGHWGWRADELANALPGWLRNYTPTIALVHAGTNDVFQGNDVDSTILELQAIVEALRARSPSVAVLLAEIIPSTGGSDPQAQELNARIGELVVELDAPGSPVRRVPRPAGFDAAVDTYDGTHPSESGERKMAEAWHAAIASLVRDDAVAPCP